MPPALRSYPTNLLLAWAARVSEDYFGLHGKTFVGVLVLLSAGLLAHAVMAYRSE